jgi:nitroreductase
MNKPALRVAQLALAVLLIFPSFSLAQELKAIQLLPPQTDRGRPLMQVLKDREFYAAARTGFISQNVYLFCASEGLATVVRALVDRPALARAMGLRPDQRITLVQTVGYPRK